MPTLGLDCPPFCCKFCGLTDTIKRYIWYMYWVTGTHYRYLVFPFVGFFNCWGCWCWGFCKGFLTEFFCVLNNLKMLPCIIFQAPCGCSNQGHRWLSQLIMEARHTHLNATKWWPLMWSFCYVGEFSSSAIPHPHACFWNVIDGQSVGHVRNECMWIFICPLLWHVNTLSTCYKRDPVA